MNERKFTLKSDNINEIYSFFFTDIHLFFSYFKHGIVPRYGYALNSLHGRTHHRMPLKCLLRYSRIINGMFEYFHAQHNSVACAPPLLPHWTINASSRPHFSQTQVAPQTSDSWKIIVFQQRYKSKTIAIS